MGKLLALGEALIDFIPVVAGKQLKEVEAFQPLVGGAPANVCGAFARLGGKAAFITQLGEDAFGDKIIEELQKWDIETDLIQRTKEANTCLAFVSLKEDGNRDFSFYRKPSADMLLKGEKIEKGWFQDVSIFHFGSVSLGNFPMKEAHKKAITYGREEKAIISFDPNIRLPLWEKPEELCQVVKEFLPYANIVKISDEELEFITGFKTIEEAKEQLFVGNVELILYTEGKNGARAYTKEIKAAVGGISVKAVDTTGAGDGFMGSFLYQLERDYVTVDQLPYLAKRQLEQYLEFSNRFSANSVMHKGAISSYLPLMD